jgi:hypothetical protein
MQAQFTILNKKLGTIKGESGIFLIGTGTTRSTITVTIIGTGGTAVNMGGGDDTVILRSDSRVTGNVVGGAGTDSILFEGTGELMGGTALDFENITKTGSGTWTVNGDLHSGKTISVYGGSTSILKVNGDYTQDANSTFIVEFLNGYTGRSTPRRRTSMAAWSWPSGTSGKASTRSWRRRKV